ncbi:MAG: alanine--tRNA ligase [Chloroflexi bacterium]|nr:MAG: alanine--tRNA ligase [Chloroflexota bacterium]RLC87791.1 MAG: alanine--tRNA ligase [Chloroflexota bacterium]
MKKMTSAEIRKSFLDFFADKKHTIVPSASLVPADDPSLLFTNAGMNQFKDVFLGLGSRDYARAADTQKCMRVSGKHNDLDDVGRDGSHHTFFEMMGNWSFGDYYKKEAIGWAWEFLTETLGLPAERLWATVFEDELGELEADEEAAGFWRSETIISPDHILYDGRKENFWEMADTGPCGPCSEIHYDRGAQACDRQGEAGHTCRVNGDCNRFIELWNLVFIQYNKDSDGNLRPLPAKHVDTGMGFERLSAVIQDVDSNYKTDLFTPIIQRVQEMAGHTKAQVEENIVAYRVIADHGRAVTFLTGDGVIPGNEGRNYVLRMILRRAARFGRKLGFTQPFLAEVAQVVIETMGPQFPELANRRQFILTTITQEEERFLRTLDLGLARLNEILAKLEEKSKSSVPGDVAFRLYDTFGLPLEITRDVAEEHGMGVDEAGYQGALAEQRQRGRQAETLESPDDETLKRYTEILANLQGQKLLGESGVEHDPYSTTDVETTIVAILRDGEPVKSAKEGEQIEVVLPVTCFYVESGGQVSDAGIIASYLPEETEPIWEIEVQEALRPVPGLIVHAGIVKQGQPRVGDKVWIVVDYARRLDIARNHTATHLLHSELRYVLGEHVAQAGSLVEPERLRFDFTHPAMLTEDELDTVTRSVNDAILVNYPVEVTEEKYRQAISEGVIGLFGEKYGDVVRVLRIGWPGEPFSQELCGGTHVDETGEIGLFHIVSEGGIGAGVRRIEAVTGRVAVDVVERQSGALRRAGAYLGVSPDEVERRTLGLLDELQSARKEITRLQEQLARHEFEALLNQVQTVAGTPLLSARVTAPSMEVLREMTDWFRDQLGSGVVALGTALSERPALVVAVTPDLVERGVDATNLVRNMARIVGGGGGGRPTLAQAGGRDAARLDDALGQAAPMLKEMLETET